MDRLQAMSAFVTVAELRGFARAARKLRLTPSTVTRAVAALEEHLGTRLLQRTTRAVSLTSAGASYLERARRILADVGDAESAARAERREPAGRFVITAPAAFGRRHVAPLWADFLARHPQLRGELVLADRLVGLVEEEVDLAVRIGVLADSSLRARPVGATRRVLVASPSYLAARRPPRAPEDLARHALIQQATMTPGREWRFVGHGRERRVEVQPAYVSNDAEAARVLAERGLGVAMLLSYQVLDQLRAGALQILLPRFEPPPLPIQLVHPGARHPSANVRAFVEFVVAQSRWQFVEL